MTKMIPFNEGGSIRLITEQEHQERMALLEFSQTLQNELEEAHTAVYGDKATPSSLKAYRGF